MRTRSMLATVGAAFGAVFSGLTATSASAAVLGTPPVSMTVPAATVAPGIATPAIGLGLGHGAILSDRGQKSAVQPVSWQRGQ